MKHFFFAVAVMAASLMFAQQAHAVIIIDDFNDGNLAQVPESFGGPVAGTVDGGRQMVRDSSPTGGPETDTDTGVSGVLGGQRTLSATLQTNGASSATVSVNDAVFGSVGQLDFEADPFTADGSFSVLYDGDFNGAAAGTAIDLTEGGLNTGFMLQGVTFTTTAGGNLALAITVNGLSGAAATVLIPNLSAGQDFFKGFSEFTGDLNAFTEATSISLSSDPSSGLTTFQMNQFSATTPEPASLTLLGIGAASMFGYGWRRRRQRTTVA